LGYSEKIVRFLEKLYDGTFSAVRIGGGLTDGFKTIDGVLQRGVLSPLLFNILLEIILAEALHNVDVSVVLSGNVINNSRFADDRLLPLLLTMIITYKTVDGIYTERFRLGMMINRDNTEAQLISKSTRKDEKDRRSRKASQTSERILLPR